MMRSAAIALVMVGALAGVAGLRWMAHEARPRSNAPAKTSEPLSSALPETATAMPAAQAVAATAASPLPMAEAPAPRTDMEGDVRHIDDLVAAGRVGEAHAEATDFVQQHPTGPLAVHVMALMGVHPRPAGAVPPTPRNDDFGR
jgi:hypothetical protein